MLCVWSCYAPRFVLEMNGTGRGRPARRSKLIAAKRGRSLFFLITWNPLSWLNTSPTWSLNPFAEYQWVHTYFRTIQKSLQMYVGCTVMICLFDLLLRELKPIWHFLPTGNALQFPCSSLCSSLCSLCQFVDYQNYIRNCCMKDIPVMERSIALCNGISQWVQLMVLSRPTAQLRAEVFTKFIHVAQVVVKSVPHCYFLVSVPCWSKKWNCLTHFLLACVYVLLFTHLL